MVRLSRSQLYMTAFLGLLWILTAVMTQLWLVPKKLPRDYDVYPLWSGSRALLQGQDPYSDAFARDMLQQMGYPVNDVYQHRFYYPATIAFILLPLWLIPFPVALVIWCGLQLLLVMTLPLLVFTLLEWRIPPLLLAMIAVFSVVPWRHSANSYVLGQFTIYTLGCFVLAWWALVQNRSSMTAIVLVGATLRAEGIILVAAALLYLLVTRRFRIVVTWAGIMTVVFGLSLIFGGWWINNFLDGIRGYQNNQATALPAALTGVEGVTYVIVAVILTWGIYMVWSIRALPERFRIPWMLAVALLVALLTLRQTKDYTLVYALLPIWIIAWAGRKQPWNTGGVLLILISPWIYNAVGANMGHDSQVEQFLTPMLLAGLLTYQWFRWKQPYTQPTGITVSTVSA